MAQTKGLVIDAGKDGRVLVATERKGACGSCQSTQHCHACLTNSRMTAEALNPAGAKVGDLVDISIDSGALLKGAAVLYLIPVAGLMAGALLGDFLSVKWAIDKIIAAIAFGFAGLCSGFFITAFISKRISENDRMTPRISRIVTCGKAPFRLVSIKECSECK